MLLPGEAAEAAAAGPAVVDLATSVQPGALGVGGGKGEDAVLVAGGAPGTSEKK